MKICIIGGGGQIADAICALLIQRGFQVVVYRPNSFVIPGVPVRPIRSRSRLTRSHLTGNVLSKIDTGVISYSWASESDLKSVDVFIYAMPSFLIEPIATRMASFLSRKVFINVSDRFLGTYALIKTIIDKKLSPPSFCIAFSSPPMIAYQPIRDGITKVFYDKTHVTCSCFPITDAAMAYGLMNEIFGIESACIKMLPSMLELAFENTQSIVHAVQDLYCLKKGLYSIRGFSSRYDGCVYTPEIVDRVNNITKERDAISFRLLGRCFRNLVEYDRAADRQKLGTGYYGTALYRQENAILRSVPRPAIYYAHGYEDVGWSLVPLESVARLLNLASPQLSILIDEWCEFMSHDYRKTGRTIRSLGLYKGANGCFDVLSPLDWQHWNWAFQV